MLPNKVVCKHSPNNLVFNNFVSLAVLNTTHNFYLQIYYVMHGQYHQYIVLLIIN